VLSCIDQEQLGLVNNSLHGANHALKYQ